MLIREEKNTAQVNKTQSRWLQVFHLDWLGQMIASMLWAASVFAYGVNSTGDLLQLGAALAWMVANIAALLSSQPTSDLQIAQNSKKEMEHDI